MKQFIPPWPCYTVVLIQRPLSVAPPSTVRACLDLLMAWIHRYIDSQDTSGRQACCDISLHGPFYTACQAVFYTLIFRHRAMLEGNMKKGTRHLLHWLHWSNHTVKKPQIGAKTWRRVTLKIITWNFVCVSGLEYLQSLNLERVVMCQLNPLRVCLPAVTSMFAAITRYAHAAYPLPISPSIKPTGRWSEGCWSWLPCAFHSRKYQVVFCYTIIEKNNRVMLPVVRSSSGGDSVTTNTNPLDSFFPFDPYLLKRYPGWLTNLHTAVSIQRDLQHLRVTPRCLTQVDRDLI